VYPLLHTQSSKLWLPTTEKEKTGQNTQAPPTNEDTLLLYFPAGQSVHMSRHASMLTLPAGDIVLSGQDWQLSEVELSPVEYFPAGQFMQGSLPAAALYLPASHLSHPSPNSSGVCPASQSRGSTDIGVEKNVVVLEDKKCATVVLGIVGAGVVADKLVRAAEVVGEGVELDVGAVVGAGVELDVGAGDVVDVVGSGVVEVVGAAEEVDVMTAVVGVLELLMVQVSSVPARKINTMRGTKMMKNNLTQNQGKERA